MPKVSPGQVSFAAGEFSPLAQGRVDSDRHKEGLELCQRYIGLLQGALVRCPGSHFVQEVKDSSKITRIYPFRFSTTQAYHIEFGDQYCRFYKDNAIITLTAQNITGITKANPAVVTYAGADTYANGDRVKITSVAGMVEVNNREFTVANVNTGANTFELSGVDSTNYTTYTSGGSVAEIYEISTPYLEAHLSSLRFTQSADTLYITHPSYAPRKLTRSAHTTWTLTSITFLDGPYLPANTTSTTFAPNATTGSGITITASTNTFASTDVGRLIRINSGGQWGTARIVTYVDPQNVSADVIHDFGTTAATTDWRLGIWSATTGYPAVSCFHEDRLFFSGATAAPNRDDGSCTGDYENFKPTTPAGTVTANLAVSISLNSNEVNSVRWMASDEKGLQNGTAGGEWVLRPASLTEALSPTNVSAKKSSAHGSANIAPVQVGKATIFVQASGRKVRELRYFYDVDGFEAPDLTRIGEHITQGGLVSVAYQQEPHSLLWANRADGMLIAATYERESDTLSVGWSRQPLSGYSDSSNNPAIVEWLSVAPSADGTYDEVWMIVKRYINGGTKRYVEYIGKFMDDETDAEDAFFVDCGVTYSGSSATTISGLWHLRGEAVDVLADGAYQSGTVSATGVLTLTTAATKAHIGYSAVAKGKLLRLDAGSAMGSSIGKTRRVNAVTFDFHRTGTIEYGMDFDEMTVAHFRDAGETLGAATPLYSGLWRGTTGAGYDTENQICFRQAKPFPGTIRGIFQEMETQDR